VSVVDRPDRACRRVLSGAAAISSTSLHHTFCSEQMTGPWTPLLSRSADGWVPSVGFASSLVTVSVRASGPSIDRGELCAGVVRERRKVARCPRISCRHVRSAARVKRAAKLSVYRGRRCGTQWCNVQET
jgi:hypothetical protein